MINWIIEYVDDDLELVTKRYQGETLIQALSMFIAEEGLYVNIHAIVRADD